MFEQSIGVTDNANNAIKNSKRFALACGEQFVGSEHLLYGLASVTGSVASRILGAEGVDAKNLQKAVLERKPYAKQLSSGAQIDLSPRVKGILQNAGSLSSNLGIGYIFTEHILYCLIRDKSCQGASILSEQFKIDLDAFALAIENYIQTGVYEKISASEGANAENKGKTDAKSMEKKDVNAKLPESLRDLGIDMTERARLGKMDPIIGREKETARIIEILCRKTKNNPVLIGEAGVGKSAVVEGLAQAIVQGNVPELLKGKTIFSLEMGSLMAGTKYRGSMEEKLKKAIEEITSSKNIIVFIDEIHTLAQAGSHDNELSPADILKPYLARGEMQTIGATTTDEYRKFIEADKALERRFQPIMVNEPTPADTIKILKGIRDSYEGFHKVKITDDAIEAAVNLSVRYIMDRSLPDKAIDLIDEASSRAKVQGSIIPSDIKALQNELREAEVHLLEAQKLDDYTLTEQWKQKIQALKGDINVRMNAWNESKGNQTGVVSKEEIAKVVSNWTGVPVTKLTESEKDRLVHLEDILHKRVIGQDEAVKAVSRAIRRSRAGLGDPNRPIGSFIFLGPTGVGKTELTKALAEALFDDENAVIRVDMSEYMESHSVSKMIGSPPGYVGFDDGGQLTEQVRRKPYSVVLFDEIEKAHPDIFNLLLQVLDEGRLTDSKGRTVSFKNTVIIMTSNVGVADLPTNTKKLGFNDAVDDKVDIKEHLMNSLKAKFKPEFINRVDMVIIFDRLTSADIAKIANIFIAKLNKKLEPSKIKLSFDSSAMDQIVKLGYSEVYGARPLKRVIEQNIEDKLADELLAGNLTKNSKIEASFKNGEFVFKKID